MDPKNIWITFPELLIWFPLIAGLVAFIIRKEKAVKNWAILASLITLGISVVSLAYADNTKHFYLNNVSYFWLKYLGSNFTLGLFIWGFGERSRANGGGHCGRASHNHEHETHQNRMLQHHDHPPSAESAGRLIHGGPGGVFPAFSAASTGDFSPFNPCNCSRVPI